MIIDHKIEYVNNNKVLYIFFDFSYEFGKFGYIKEEDVFSKILKYISEKKIKFNGKTIMLCISGIVFATLSFIQETNKIDFNYNNIEVFNTVIESSSPNIITDEENIVSEKLNQKDEIINNTIEKENVNVKKEEKNEVMIDKIILKKVDKEKEEKNENINNKEETKYINPVTIYRNNGEIITLELEEYLIGVVSAEMPASFNIEALKAQVVAARTYTLKYISEGRKLTDTEATQSYNDMEQLKTKWGLEFDKYYKKIEEAVKSTEGIYMTYNGRYIDAVYHASNNGYTVSSSNVWGNNIPYLQSVESIWDINSTSYLRNVTFSLEKFNQKLGMNCTLESVIEIKKDETKHVLKVIIDGVVFTGIEFRQKLGLRSTDFDIEIKESNIEITTKGYGHGVGMSQYGANGMANNGYNYLEILKHYYSGIKIENI